MGDMKESACVTIKKAVVEIKVSLNQFVARTQSFAFGQNQFTNQRGSD